MFQSGHEQYGRSSPLDIHGLLLTLLATRTQPWVRHLRRKHVSLASPVRSVLNHPYFMRNIDSWFVECVARRMPGFMDVLADALLQSRVVASCVESVIHTGVCSWDACCAAAAATAAVSAAVKARIAGQAYARGAEAITRSARSKQVESQIRSQEDDRLH